ncbi:AraC family transcriptional regulator [Planctomycetes bacterium CA13]|uniref:helix-turn-helix domain-containing protein n=1 Tax=Novipirellula herctigrandis TaxID=2527986 RepID=UPI0011B4B160
MAFACGVSDQSYLARQFKRHTGMTPTMYRQKRQHLISTMTPHRRPSQTMHPAKWLSTVRKPKQGML